jgi:hypothetical protein
VWDLVGAPKRDRAGRARTTCKSAAEVLVQAGADARATLAAVLGVPAGEIRMGRRAPGQSLLLGPVRSPGSAPIPPAPIRRIRSQSPPRQAFLLETTSKRIGTSVKTLAHARRLILAADFFRRDTGGQNQRAKTVSEPQGAPSHQRGPLRVRPHSGESGPIVLCSRSSCRTKSAIGFFDGVTNQLSV